MTKNGFSISQKIMRQCDKIEKY